MSEQYNSEAKFSQAVRGLLSPEQVQLLAGNGLRCVSGQPLHFIPSDPEEPWRSFDNGEPLYEEKVYIQRVFVQRIPRYGHPHLDEKYLSDEGYPAVQCLTMSGDEIIFGIREALNFEIV